VQRHPEGVADAALETDTGARLTLADLRGKWLLVDFIYTRCATYCTALGTDFAQLQQRLAAPLAQRRVVLVSISFDPVHDSPARLAAYLARSGDRGSGWIAARPDRWGGARAFHPWVRLGRDPGRRRWLRA
jgi:protein SCO1/2